MPDSPLSREEHKQVAKEAYKEWLAEEKAKFQQSVGKWFINVSIAALVGALAYFTLTHNGWQHK